MNGCRLAQGEANPTLPQSPPSTPVNPLKKKAHGELSIPGVAYPIYWDDRSGRSL